jgi:DNA polymerase-3 subunit beta
MSLTLNASRSAILSALSDAASTRDRNPANPIYNAVLLTFEKNNISVRAISQSGSVRILCVGNGSGSACFNPDELIAWLKVCSDDVVRLEDADNERIEAKCGKSSRKIACVPPSTFPVPRDEDTKPAFTIKGNALVEALASASVSMAPADNKYGLSVVHIEYEPGTAMLTATDGNRLIRVSTTADTTETGSFDMTAVSVANVRKIHKDTDVDVKVSVGSAGYSVDSGDVSMHFRKAEVQYPDYRVLVPKKHRYSIRFNREHMIGVMLRMSVGVDTGKVAETRLAFSGNEIEIVRHAEHGRAVETAPFGMEGGGNADLTINAVYMAELLRTMTGDDVVFHFYNPGGDDGKAWSYPCLIEPAEKPENYSDIYLIMPIAPIAERK